MSTNDILNKYGKQYNMSKSDIIDALARYIENQDSDDAFEDFMQRYGEELEDFDDLEDELDDDDYVTIYPKSKMLGSSWEDE